MKKLLLVVGLGLTILSCQKDEIKVAQETTNKYRVEINAHEITNMVQPNYDIRIVEEQNDLVMDTIVNNDDSTFVYEWSRPNKKIVNVIFYGNSTTSVNIKLFKNGIIEDYTEGYNNLLLTGVY